MQNERVSRREFLRVAALAAAGAAVGGCIPLDLLSTAIPTATPTPTATATPTVTAKPPPTTAPVPSPTPEPTPEGPVTIRWYGPPAGDPMMPVEWLIVDYFNQLQDDVEIVWEFLDPDGWPDMLQMIARGDGPDVLGPVGMQTAGEFLDYWLDLDPFLKDYDLGDCIDIAAVFDVWRPEGRGLIGFPIVVYPSMIYYNRDLFDAAGLAYPPHWFGEPYADGEEWTVEKMEEVATLLALDAGGNDATSPDFDPEDIAQFGYHTQWTDARGMATLFGAGSFVADDGRTARCPDHWREAFHWYHEGMWEKHFMPNGPYQGSDLLDYGNPFNSGRVAMVHCHLWYLCCLEDVPNWDLAVVPAYGGRATAKLHSDMIGILNTTAHPEEAMRVLYYLALNAELIAELIDYSGALPLRMSMLGEHLERLNARFPQGVDWRVAVLSLDYPDIPSHESRMPNSSRANDRVVRFANQLNDALDLDVDAAIDELVADLQVIFDE